MACVNGRNTDTLYELSVSAVIDSYQCFKNELRMMPENVMFDLYHKLYTEKRLCLLGLELSEIDIFSRLLRVSSRRQVLLRMFQKFDDLAGVIVGTFLLTPPKIGSNFELHSPGLDSLMDHGTRVSRDLALCYARKCSIVKSNPTARDMLIDLGLRLGGFLSDSGWFSDAEKVLISCRDLCQSTDATPRYWKKTLGCCHKLLHVQTASCNYKGAEVTYQLAIDILDKLQKASETTNFAGLFAEFSALHFSRSDYNEAYKWSTEALRHVDTELPTKVTVDVLRHGAKACVVKRDFKKAGLLARQAVNLSKDAFNSEHTKYADALVDYGFYLLNFDSVQQSVLAYETALDIRREIFGKINLHVAIAHEDLAYALYVHEYSSGRFLKAREHAEKAIEIMSRLLPENHLMLASVKRVKALILEEIALDTVHNNTRMADLLRNAEDLHLSALKLATATFGEKNVQTAKHFGNLGRLYQSMKRFQDAEAMHLRAIAVKEELLGPEDYEVGLSVGHLASLYNYHMKKFRKAEQLYLRSIAISLKLFGEGYSGLEYDYRGLVHVYHALDDVDKVAEYTYLLNNWKLHREFNAHLVAPPTGLSEEPLQIEQIKAQFFDLCDTVS
ncbi:unnamed protein product [Timema podura]|uniref:Amyloid protein-binding protein 2 n=1 Tax=Timema podura TaxID=61482 RepID=A0ABN7NCW6_TIMPD|nr:unnamed protein product [Timema podura]